MASQRPLRILSLDGGGVKGLASLQMLNELMGQVRRQQRASGIGGSQELLRPCEYFDLICGTSTGGLIAIMLGRLRYDIEAAIKQYHVLSEEIFTSASTDPQALFDHHVLEKKIQEVITAAEIQPSAMLEDPGVEMDDTKCRTFVVTSRLRGAGASAVLMRTYGTLSHDPFKARIWEAARATSAAPTFFLPIKINGVAYGDGAMGWNNPTQEALNEAHHIWPNRPIGCLVSLGTGLEDAVQLMESTEHPLGGITGKALQTVSPKLEFRLKAAKYCAECVTSCERVHVDIDRNLLSNGLDGKYFRLNIPQGMGKIQLEEWKKCGDIEALAMDYMESGEGLRAKQMVAKILLDSGSSSAIDSDTATPLVSPGSSSSRPSSERLEGQRPSMDDFLKAMEQGHMFSKLRSGDFTQNLRTAEQHFLQARDMLESVNPSDYAAFLKVYRGLAQIEINLTFCSVLSLQERTSHLEQAEGYTALAFDMARSAREAGDLATVRLDQAVLKGRRAQLGAQRGTDPREISRLRDEALQGIADVERELKGSSHHYAENNRKWANYWRDKFVKLNAGG